MIMTTITIENDIDIPQTNFSTLEELYLIVQRKLAFELELQNKAFEWLNIDESELIDIN